MIPAGCSSFFLRMRGLPPSGGRAADADEDEVLDVSEPAETGNWVSVE
jgi:hypothetical protein